MWYVTSRRACHPTEVIPKGYHRFASDWLGSGEDWLCVGHEWHTIGNLGTAELRTNHALIVGSRKTARTFSWYMELTYGGSPSRDEDWETRCETVETTLAAHASKMKVDEKGLIDAIRRSHPDFLFDPMEFPRPDLWELI